MENKMENTTKKCTRNYYNKENQCNRLFVTIVFIFIKLIERIWFVNCKSIIGLWCGVKILDIRSINRIVVGGKDYEKKVDYFNCYEGEGFWKVVD